MKFLKIPYERTGTCLHLHADDINSGLFLFTHKKYNSANSVLLGDLKMSFLRLEGLQGLEDNP